MSVLNSLFDLPSKFASDRIAKSSDFQSSLSDASSEAGDLKEVLKEKEEYVVKYNLIFILVIIPTDCIYLFFFQQYNWLPKFIIGIGVTITLAFVLSFGFYYKYYRENNRKWVWIPLLLAQARLFILVNFISFSEEFYMNDEATTLRELIKIYQIFDHLLPLLFMMNKIILLEMIMTPTGTKAFVITILIELVIINVKIVLT